MARLAEIYKQEARAGGGLGTAAAKRLGERVDPRQIFDRSGIMATMFPALKSYRATTGRIKNQSITSSPSSLNTNDVSLISEATKITAKNTLALPSMARDMFLMKQNIIKLVKAAGITPQTKSGDWMSRQMARETAYEEKMTKAGSKAGSIMGVDPKKVEQSVESITNLAAFFNPKNLVATLTPVISGLGAVLMSPAFLAGIGLGGLAYLFYKMYSSKGAFLSEEEFAGVRTAEKVGGLAGVKDEADKRAKLSEYERTKAEIADYERLNNEGQKLNEKQLEGFAKRGGDSAKAVEEYKRANGITQRIPSAATDDGYPLQIVVPQGILIFPDKKTYDAWQKDPQSVAYSIGPRGVKYVSIVETPSEVTTPTTPSAGGITPTPVSAPSPRPTASTPSAAPAGAVTSSSGAPIRTGTGGYVTSGTGSTSPSQDLSIGDAINSAAGATGVSAQTLAIFGQLESGLGKAVENKLSSAKGPFQFIDSTWLAMLQKHGKKYGYDISSMTREEQLNLRFNNRASALMAAEYTKENAATLGVDPSDPNSVDELYLAHFLGPGGAKRVLSGQGLTEQQKASVMKYNPNIKSGSNEEFMQFASGKTAQAAKVSAVQQIASAPSSGTMVASASTSVADGRRQPASTGNVVVDNSQKTTVASAAPAGKPASAYDKDMVDALVSSSYA